MLYIYKSLFRYVMLYYITRVMPLCTSHSLSHSPIMSKWQYITSVNTSVIVLC